MNALNYIFLKIFREKNNIFFIVVLILSTIFLICSLTFINNLNCFIEENINKNISFRTISVSNKQDKDDLGESELLNMDHVIDVYTSAYNMTYVESDFKSENLDGKIELTYLPKSTIINTLVGSQFTEDDQNVAIIPKKFYPDSSASNYKINKNNIIDGQSLLGKEITIRYNTYIFENMNLVIDETLTKKFLVVGVYDNKEMMNYNNQVFISRKDIDEMAMAKIPQNSNSEIQISTNYTFNVVVDSLENIQTVMNKMAESGFTNIEVSVEIDRNMIDTIKNSCYIISIISIIVITFIIILYIKKKIIKESNFLGVLRTFGYSKKVIIKQYIFEILLTNCITYIIGIIILLLMYIILKNTVFVSLSYIGFNVKMYYKDFLVSLIIIILTSIIISAYFINRKLKEDIINLIESRE